LFGISGTELFFIAAFALLIFGPDKLPQFARTIGRFMKEFERVRDEAETVIKAEFAAVEKGEDSPRPEPVPVSQEAIHSAAPSLADDDEEGEEE
jgi:sec-independent protein translocase protein TatB